MNSPEQSTSTKEGHAKMTSAASDPGQQGTAGIGWERSDLEDINSRENAVRSEYDAQVQQAQAYEAERDRLAELYECEAAVLKDRQARERDRLSGVRGNMAASSWWPTISKLRTWMRCQIVFSWLSAMQLREHARLYTQYVHAVNSLGTRVSLSANEENACRDRSIFPPFEEDLKLRFRRGWANPPDFDKRLELCAPGMMLAAITTPFLAFVQLGAGTGIFVLILALIGLASVPIYLVPMCALLRGTDLILGDPDLRVFDSSRGSAFIAVLLWIPWLAFLYLMGRFRVWGPPICPVLILVLSLMRGGFGSGCAEECIFAEVARRSRHGWPSYESLFSEDIELETWRPRTNVSP